MINEDDLAEFGYYDRQKEMDFDKKPSPLDMVAQFRKAMKQTPNSTLSFRLMKEEWDEFLNAFSDENELKELADLVYVAFGYADALGWDLDEALRRVHANNMERCIWPDGSVRFREDGKVMKRPNHAEVNLSDLV